MNLAHQNIQHLIQSHPVFKQLDTREINALESCFIVESFKEGETVFQEGDSAQNCYFILSGTIEVFKDLKNGHRESLAKLQPGDLFGHIAMIDRKKRSASCRFSREGGTLWALSMDNFEKLFVAQNPLAYKLIDHIVTDLSQRLRGATTQLSLARKTQDTSKRHTHSLAAAKLLAGNFYTDEELDQVQVITTEFQSQSRYQVKS